MENRKNSKSPAQEKTVKTQNLRVQGKYFPEKGENFKQSKSPGTEKYRKNSKFLVPERNGTALKNVNNVLGLS